MKFSRAAVGLALLIALHAGQVGAQGRDAAAADALFREARTLMKGGDFKTACPKLAESQRLDPAAGTAINLGDCWEKTGALADALQSYRDALDLLKAGDPRIGPTKEQAAALEKRVPKLTIKLAPGAPEGTKVKRDDVELGAASLGVALPVNPGEHWIVVVAPGRRDKRQNVSLAEGAHRDLKIHAGARIESNDDPTREPQTRTASEPIATAEPETSTRIPWIIGAASVGVAGIVTGVVFGELASDEEDTADQIGRQIGASNSTCSGSPISSKCADLQDAVDTEKRYRGYSNVAYTVGGVGFAASALVLLFWPSGGSSPPASAHSARLYLGPHSAQLHWRF